ncbi:ABC transporter permease [Nocardioides rotundus]|uniref:ABC transporter permease n=1 Tax=Nocardioides rotundus TaxID=1774216 RepID=UPI001CBB094C|nr:ABC transporter permease [Nocardioides rotundus]UAL29156.1 ABC transporter permease [Nocardioides rotundus]
MWDFISERRGPIAYDAFMHFSLVVQCVLLATVIAVVIAVLVSASGALESVANILSAVGLTLPSLALIGLLLPFTALGTTTAVVAITFYAVLPILRNAIVGLAGVDKTLLESGRGMGMSRLQLLTKVRLPLAWPVIHAGIRISMQMSMGIAAIAALVLGPGLGKYIYTGVATTGGANALNYTLVGTIGVLLIALVVDGLLLLLGRLTISKGIRA